MKSTGPTLQHSAEGNEDTGIKFDSTEGAIVAGPNGKKARDFIKVRSEGEPINPWGLRRVKCA